MAGASETTPWHQDDPAKIATREISFVSHGTRLVGTLSYPERNGVLPAIVVTHAAEAPTRDFGLYRHLEQDLPRLGYATFVYDRRGSGASAGNLEDTDYQLLADDAVAAQKAIAGDSHVNPHAIGFWGLSQGGWLAVLAASRSPDAAFAVSVSAPLQTPAQQMAFAVSNILKTKGYDDDSIRKAIDTRYAVENYLRGKVSTADAQAALDKAKNQPWFADIFMGPTVSGHPEQSRWRKEMDYDPISPLAALKVPVLVLFGSDDPWVPVQDSLQGLANLKPSHPNIDVHVIAGADHMMMPPPRTNPMAYDPKTLKAQAPATPAYFLTLADWLDRSARSKPLVSH
ncbi:alpha/beta hydrolase family protein [Dyella choica]|nr:alpha/beta fold hydrolase [Dyella choica]